MDPLPPDPYAALGVSREATAAEIKTAYRKAALRSHPDKAQDKAKATDEFHKIQQAYELLNDDTERQKYDDQVRLAGLRREFFGSGGIGVNVRTSSGGPPPNVEIRTAKFDVRSSPGPSAAAFTATGPSRYEDRAGGGYGTRSFEEDLEDPSYFSARTRPRKSSGFDNPATRKPSAKTSRPAEDMSKSKSRPSPKQKQRNEKQKQRDKETREETRRKFAYVDDSEGSDDYHMPGAFYETPRRHDGDKERPRSYEERRSRDSKQSDEDARVRKYQDHTSKAEAHIRSSRGETPFDGEVPPPLSRSASYQVDQNTEYRRSPRDNRPGFVRRSKDKPAQADSPSPRSPGKERSSKKSSGDKQRAESIDLSSSPTARKSTERGAAPPPPLQTSFSDMRDNHRRSSPPPRIPRADTMPLNGTTPPRNGPRRTDTAPVVSSGLRHHEEAAGRQQERDSGYSTSSPSEEPNNQDMPESRAYSTKYYYKDSAGENDSSGKDGFEYTNGRPTILREPGRSMRSSSPTSYADRERSPATTSRQNSYRSPAMASTGLGGGSSKRPSVSRENSTSTFTPSFTRDNSMPIPSRTESGSYITKETTPKPGRVTSEDISSSPIELHFPNLEGLGINTPPPASSSKRQQQQQQQSDEGTPRSSRRRGGGGGAAAAVNLDNNRDYEAVSPASRRASEDLRKSLDDYGSSSSMRTSRRSSERDVEARMAAATQHMDRKARGERDQQGQQQQQPPTHAETFPTYEKPDKSSYKHPTLKRAGTMA